jgi:hypothetical protein
MRLVSRVDSLWTVSTKKVLIKLKSRSFLKDRNAVLFGFTGIDRGLIDDDITRLQSACNCLTGKKQWLQFRSIVGIYWRGNGNDVAIAIAQIFCLGGKGQVNGGLKPCSSQFKRLVIPPFNWAILSFLLSNPSTSLLRTEFDSQELAQITQTDDRKINVVCCINLLAMDADGFR